ncbi:MAG: M14 family zinc carboxypeptidase [Rubripirellula sp.]|nr:M14 family zinc carboxypeptidase [Rubripirellula sp.]
MSSRQDSPHAQATSPMNPATRFGSRSSQTCHYLAIITIFASLGFTKSNAQPWQEEFATPFEMSDGWQSADYKSVIQFYDAVAKASDRITITEMGNTDSGTPLHLVLISSDKELEVGKVLADPRPVLMILNAIHPGEPDGIDASMAFTRDLAFDDAKYARLLKEVIVAVVPIYNIGGALNRNSSSRANQNGPREYGFRGNARNFDLNRDFVKCDTLNARSFAEIFHLLDPDLLIDTHVSNGADYQHVMTTSQSQSDKLGLELGVYLRESFEPALFGQMKQVGFHTIPYVNSSGKPPEYGFPQFLETPRYSTGFAALFQTIGFMTETHMLKPYPQRVKATRAFLDESIKLLVTEGSKLQAMRRQDRDNYHQQQRAAIAWEVDLNNPSRLEFNGFASSYIDSKITPGKRLNYDRSKPFTQAIPYFNRYKVSQSVELPAGYLIPQQWHQVIELMKINRVEMLTVQNDKELPAEIYQIEKVESRAIPYEGHYLHDTVELTSRSENYSAKAGDVIIPIHQDRARYVVETLEPAAMDSLFRWNFFDTVLQRKEYFSPYIFEETAEKMLTTNKQIRQELEHRKQEDASFATDRRAQLMFLYQRSKHNEASFMRYPVIRLLSLPNSKSDPQD